MKTTPMHTKYILDTDNIIIYIQYVGHNVLGKSPGDIDADNTTSW